MKKIINQFIFIILIACFQICFAQDSSKAVLVDKIGPSFGCCDFSARLDNWFGSVSNTPNSIGYAVIRGHKNNLLQRISLKEMIYGQLRFRFIEEPEKEKFVVVEGELTEDLSIELWIVSKKSKTPFETNTKWDYSLPLNKNLLYYDSSNDGGTCPDIDRVKVIAELLQVNQNLRANVVFYENKMNGFRKRKVEFLKEMNVVSQDQLRFYRSTQKYEGHFEVWLVPKKK